MITSKRKPRTVNTGRALRLVVLVAALVSGASEVDAAEVETVDAGGASDAVTQQHGDKGGLPASPEVVAPHWTSWLDDAHLLSVFAPVSDAVLTPECRSHSRRFVEGVRAREPWALKMLDASTKLPEGAMVGNLLHLGNYDECLSIRGVSSNVGVVSGGVANDAGVVRDVGVVNGVGVVSEEGVTDKMGVASEGVASAAGVFSGRHCLVGLGDGYFSSIKTVDRMVGIPSLRNMAVRAENSAGDATAFLSELGATVSVCVPSSCTSRDLEGHLRSSLNVTVSVTDLGCHSREDDEGLSRLDWLAILVVSALLLAVVGSTYYDLTQGQSASYNALLASFSLRTNTRALLNTRPLSADPGLAVLDGLRVLNTLFVFAVHCSFLKVFVTACGNLFDNQQGMYDLKNMPSSTSVPVDSFLLLSGLLVSYNYFKDRERGVEFSLARFYRHRLVRVAPCYAMVVLFSATILYHLGDGPLWKTNMVPVRDGCRDEWLYGLLYINNYYPSVESVMHMRCLSESWYLSVDMQLFWLSPLILYPLWRWRRLGKCLFAAVMAAGLAIAYAVPYINEMRYSLIPADRSYFTTHTRFTPWLLGAGLGYLLHATKRSPPVLSRCTLVLGHLLSGLLMLAVLFLPYHFLREDYVYDRTTTSLFYCLLRPSWALALAWVIFTAARGYNRPLYSVLSWPKFQILSRLSFALYITQLDVLRLVYMSTRVTYHVTGLTAMIDFLGIGGVALAVAYLLHVLVEAPVSNIERDVERKRVPKVETKVE